MGDTAEFSVHAGSGYDAAAVAVGYSASHVSQGRSIGYRCIVRCGGGGLIGGTRFAGEQRFVGLQACRFAKPQVGRHAIPDIQNYKITRHQARGIYEQPFTVANYDALRLQHFS